MIDNRDGITSELDACQHADIPTHERSSVTTALLYEYSVLRVGPHLYTNMAFMTNAVRLNIQSIY